MAEYEDAKWVAANRNTVVVGQSRSEDEVFLIPNGVYDLYKSRGLVRDVPDPNAPEAEEEAEAGTAESEATEEEPAAEDAGEAADEGDEPDQPEDGERSEDEDEVPEWDLTMDPAPYLKRYPDGDHAEKAREVLEARGEEIPA